MNTQRMSALPVQVDLRGLPAAWLREALLAFASLEASAVFDAQLADLHAEWLAARERSRLRAAWLGLGIRAHLLTGALYYAGASLGPSALRRVLIIGIAGCITLAMFLGLASLIAPRPAPPRIPVVRVPEWEVRLPEPRAEPHRPRRPEPPQLTPPEGRYPVVVQGVVDGPGPEGPSRVTTDPGPWSQEVAPLLPGPPEPMNSTLCVPLVRREPDYPAYAERRRIEGAVVVEVAIDGSGSVTGAQVLSAEPAGVFDDAVLRAVRRWRYRVAGARGAGCDRTQVRLLFELPTR